MRCLEARINGVAGFDAAREEAHGLVIAEAQNLGLDLDWSGAHSKSAKIIQDKRWVYEYVLRVPVIDREDESDDDDGEEG